MTSTKYNIVFSKIKGMEETTKSTTLPSKIKSDVVEFVRLDDGLKVARTQAKEARDAMNECRERIVDYMKESEIERLGIKKGQQFLELCEKQLKVRPTAECVKSKLQELMSKNVIDPETIYTAISECGGTKTEWKLARRSKRQPGRPKKDADKDEHQPKKRKRTVVSDDT